MACTSHKFDHRVPNSNLAAGQKGVYHARYTIVFNLKLRS